MSATARQPEQARTIDEVIDQLGDLIALSIRDGSRAILPPANRSSVVTSLK